MEDRLNKYIGLKYGYLTITGIDRVRMSSPNNRSTYVIADCDCGVCGKSYNLARLKSGATKSCGHLKLQHGRQYKTNKIELFNSYGVIYCKEKPFYFDIEDLDILSNKYWYEDDHGYLTHAYTVDGKCYYIRFHRIIMNASYSMYVDHINRKKNDNRKSNLRICSHKENDRNNNLYKNNTSGIIGVYYDHYKNKWVAHICVNRKNIYLGGYNIFEDAIKARLKGEIKYFGDFAPQKHLYQEEE